ncbi:glycosyltransferase family 2 protein [Pseudomaricurvus alcaniphilus]|uniref:glycosyltransferase family 2 protein n=1 Tax=Pseudomaricurvus alcaniphilus TaxID=1166482 RepID=UPI001407A073|nr:glycosyltransferase family 2 protein [Pseudomaricurvus alcaniphilus]NHN37619.1 glycosyltransferase family 2 protein [Pseudomaricurvus alcaniphilus]
MLEYLLLLLRLIRNPACVPLRGLRKLEARRDDANAFAWQSLDEDPQFKIDTRFWWPGWYMLEVAVSHDQPAGTASLYIDYGNDFSADSRIDLPLKQGALCKRLVYLPVKARALRLDPLESTGQFTLKTCRLVWLTPSFALSRLLRRLAYVHPDYRDLPTELVFKRLKECAAAQGVHWRSWALRSYEDTFLYFLPENSYRQWLSEIENADLQLDAEVPERLGELGRRPLISILLPVYNTEPQLLEACVQSVLAQSYPNWQLCIADDASTDRQSRAALQRLAQLDERIDVVWREENGHICAASNSALELARGEYCALLDHDDELARHALYYVAEALNDNPQALLLYSDEDKLDRQGRRYDPHFKSGWDPDRLLSQNYISHLGVYQTRRLQQIGGFRRGYEGSQDHDLVLRFSAGLDRQQVAHIPRILYHWRAVAGSTALASGEKDYTADAGLRAVQDYLDQQASGATAEMGMVPNSYRVIWPLPEPAPLVSLLVPTRDRCEILQPCVDAILERTEYRNFELIILDNQSRCAETLAYMEEVRQRDSRVRVEHWDHPFNYSAINNFGVSVARGGIIGLVNNDIEPINAGWLTELVRHACRPAVGCVGAKLYYPNDTIQHGGVILGIGGVAGHAHKYRPRDDYGYFSRLQLVQSYSAVTAACLLVRKSVFEQVGGLNEKDLKVAFNDVDLCLKVRAAGYRNLWTPYAELYHHESVSRGEDNSPEKQQRFQDEIRYMRKTWGSELDSDPAYNPNLTLAFEDFSLR